MSDNILVLAGVPLFGLAAYVTYSRTRTSGIKTTPLRGPPSDNWFLGQTRGVYGAKEAKYVTEEWLEKYGGVFRRPGPFWSSDLCVLDPKAVAHVLGHSEKVYHIQPLALIMTRMLVGSGLLAADGESHKRQRKNISPGFTSIKIREYLPTFYDSAHKLENHWKALLDNKEDPVIDIQKWFGPYALDTIGLAGFSHDFGALDSKPSAVATAFADFADAGMGLGDAVVFFVQFLFPQIISLPTPRQRAINNLHEASGQIAKEMIKKVQMDEREKGERSVMGLMIKAASSSSGITLSEEEVTAQIRTLLLAGYETTSASLTWTMIELCRNPDLQARVRAELLAAFPVEDPTHEELASETPLLDAVVHEVFRLHPPVLESWRTAQQDDIIPLYTPITLPDGSVTNQLVIAKGQTLSIHIQGINHNRTFWGEDAYDFVPERWLSDLPEKAAAISAYRHTLTFLDGPKVCLGRSFAVTNIKAALAVLLRKFSFEMLNGPETKIDEFVTIVHRPKEEAEEGPVVRMRVKLVE